MFSDSPSTVFLATGRLSLVLSRACFVVSCLLFMMNCEPAAEDVLRAADEGMVAGRARPVLACFTPESRGLLALLAYADDRFALTRPRSAQASSSWAQETPDPSTSLARASSRRGEGSARSMTVDGWRGVVLLQQRAGEWLIDMVATERAARAGGGDRMVR